MTRTKFNYECYIHFQNFSELENSLAVNLFTLTLTISNSKSIECLRLMIHSLLRIGASYSFYGYLKVILMLKTKIILAVIPSHFNQ